MTVASEVNRSGPYIGNGVTTVFNYGFKIVSENHLRVIRAAADGAETTLVIDADYIVSDVGEDGGGQIAMMVAPSATQTITILRNVPFVQETDLENQGAYYAETVEDSFDLSVMRDQQLAEMLSRAVLVPASEGGSAGDLSAQLARDITRLAASADNVDTVAASANNVDTVADNIADVQVVADNIAAVSAASGSVLSLVDQSYVATAGQTVFTLPAAAISDENVLVWVNDVRQVPGVEYSVSGLTMTLTAGASAGTPVDVLVITAVSMQDVQELRDEAVEASIVAQATNGSGFQSRADFIAALPVINPIVEDGQSVLVDGLIYVRDAASTMLPGAAGWRPGNPVTLRHFGAVGDGVTVDSPAIAAAYSALPAYIFDLDGGNYLMANGSWDGIRGMKLTGSGKLLGANGAGPLLENGMLSSASSVDIGVAGFSRVQYAIDFLALYQPANDGQVVARILTGFSWLHGVVIPERTDLSWITLRQQTGATITLPAGFTGIATPPGGDNFSANCLWYARNCHAPMWELMVNCADRGGSALIYTMGARGTVRGFYGVTNAAGYGLYVNTQSDVIATNAVFTNSAWGNRVTTNSRLNAPQANFSGCRNEFYEGANRAANLDVSRGSTVYITGAVGGLTNLTGGQGRGLAVRRSYVSATHVNCSGVLRQGLAADIGAVVAFDESVANNCETGVYATSSSVSLGTTASMTGCGRGMVAQNGATIMGRNTVCTGATTNGALATYGGDIRIPGISARKGVSDGTEDLFVTVGGTIIATSGTGGANVTLNTMTANGYVMK